MFAHSLASMDRFGGVTDFLLSLFVRVPELCPAARFFSSTRSVMPEREEPHFHVSESKARGRDATLGDCNGNGGLGAASCRDAEPAA